MLLFISRLISRFPVLRRLGSVPVCVLLLLDCAGAQQSALLQGSAVPNLVRFSGHFDSARGGSVGAIFALYKDQTGGAPLWQEVQTISVDASGRYVALLGSASTGGIPVDLFGSGEARWLGVQPQGEAEQARVLLVSVPYAIKAADAQTLGGLPASAFLRADGGASSATPTNNTYINRTAVTSAAISAVSSIATKPALTSTGASAGFLPVFTDAAGDIANSAFFQLNAGTVANPVWNLGLGTTTPSFNLQFVSTVDPAAVAVDGYGIVGVNFIGRRARGTLAAPAPIQTGDNIMAMQGRGYGTTGFSSSSRAYMKFWAAENWTDSAQGTYISLATTPKGTAASAERFRILDNGNVGIGTTTPANPLSVSGIIESTSGGFKFPDGTIWATAAGGATLTSPDGSITVGGTATARTIAVNTANIQKRVAGSCAPGAAMTAVNADGSTVCGLVNVASLAAHNTFNLPQTINVGTGYNVGLTVEADGTGLSPNAIYAINGSSDSDANAVYAVVPNAGSSASAIFGQTFGSGVPVYGNANNALAAVTAVEGDVASINGTGVQGFAFAQSGNTTAVAGRIHSPNGVAILGSGIAQTCSGATCTPVTGGTGGKFLTAAGGTLLLGQVVDANFNPTSVFRVDSSGKGFFDGGTQTGGADFAESVAVQGDRAAYSAGDLITVDPSRDRQFTRVAEPYSTLVAGIYATRPGILATPHSMSDARLGAEIPLAIVGIVPCKVSAENGPIHRGDLLVSSSTPGHAMRGTDRSRLVGAVVGKALGSLERGTGVIEVLVTLQ